MQDANWIQSMRDRDLERRTKQNAKRAAAAEKVTSDWERLQSAARAELAEARRLWRVAVDARLAAKTRMADVRRWLASERLAPFDRRAYEREVGKLWAEIRWAEAEFDRLAERYPELRSTKRVGQALRKGARA